MKFPDTGDKIKKLRRELHIKQEELNIAGVSRNFISMIENGKRKLPKHVACSLMDIFRRKANNLEIKLDFDEQWLMKSAREHAIEYCNEKLNSNILPDDIDILIKLVKDYGIKELIPQVYILKADKLYDNRFYEEAFTYYYEILEVAENQSVERAIVYNKLGKCKIMMQNYIEALTYLNKCYELSLKDNSNDNKKNCLYNMALSYNSLGSTELALDCINEFIELCQDNNNFKELMGAVILKANCYITMQEYQKAIETLTNTIGDFSNSEDVLLGYIYNNLGALYSDINELDTALQYLDKAYHIRELSDKFNLPKTVLNKAEVFMKQNNLEEALKLSNMAINLSKENMDNDFIIKCYKLLEKIYVLKERSMELKELYLEMIHLYKKLDKKEEAVKIYIKLLKTILDMGNINEYKLYLEESLELM